MPFHSLHCTGFYSLLTCMLADPQNCRHVVEACSFFKTNSALLTGSSNNIDRKLSVNRPHTSPAQTHSLRRTVSGCTPSEAPCRTCFSVRKRIHPPNWAQPPTSRHVLCDCSSSVYARDTTSSEILPQELAPSARSRISLSSKLKLHAQELSIIGLPIYAAKRTLVEHVVEGVAEIARGASASIILWSALERLLADGLKEGLCPWNVVVDVTGPGERFRIFDGSILNAIESFKRNALCFGNYRCHCNGI